MPYAILIVAVFLIVVLLLPRLVTAKPSTLAKGVRTTLAGGIFAMSAFFALRGLLPVAIPLFLLALTIYGLQRGFGGTRKSDGQKSSVRTSVLNMWLDHDSGEMDGEVISGDFTGQTLSQMELSSLLKLLEHCVAANDQSESLLMAYLDRMHPDWRETAQGSAQSSGSSMSRADALDILGLKEGATQKEIQAAYRKMMKKHHPDNGGSAYFAARINEANQVLSDKS